MISPQTIALVRERTDIVAVISESVPSLKRFGRAWKAVCPFHKEKTPSFHVNPERGWFHCFGCGEKGSAIDFVMRHDGYTFPEAVRALAERAGIPVEDDHTVGSADRAEEGRQKKQKDDLYGANNLAAMWFEQQLREHPDRAFAEEELARRGLKTSDDAVQAFRIGYAPAAWDGLAVFLKAQGISPIAAESVGLLVPRTSGQGYYDRFRHRLMFAVIDPQGRVIAFSGRALKEREGEAAGDKRDPPPKYINSPESPVYTKGNALFGLYQARHAIRTSETALLVEGNFDVVSLHARGIGTAVAPLGTAFTVDQARLLKRYTANVTILFDGDAAGRKATRASREPCRESGLVARVGSLPDGVDPDDFARSKGADALRDLVSRARGMLQYLLGALLDESFPAADPYEKVARLEQVKKLVAEEDDPVSRALAKTYTDELASRLDLKTTDGHGHYVIATEPFRALESAMQRALAAAPPRRIATESTSTERPRDARIRTKPPGSLAQAEVVGAIIEYPELLQDLEIQAHLELLEGASAQTVAAVAKSLHVGSGDEGGRNLLDTTVFLAQIPLAIQAFASKRLAAPQHETIQHARGSLIENARKLRELALERETTDIAREQEKVVGDGQAETDLLREALDRQRRRQGVKMDEGEKS